MALVLGALVLCTSAKADDRDYLACKRPAGVTDETRTMSPSTAKQIRKEFGHIAMRDESFNSTDVEEEGQPTQGVALFWRKNDRVGLIVEVGGVGAMFTPYGGVARVPAKPFDFKELKKTDDDGCRAVIRWLQGRRAR
jgi:hypothetical protein